MSESSKQPLTPAGTALLIARSILLLMSIFGWLQFFSHMTSSRYHLPVWSIAQSILWLAASPVAIYLIVVRHPWARIWNGVLAAWALVDAAMLLVRYSGTARALISNPRWMIGFLLEIVCWVCVLMPLWETSQAADPTPPATSV